MANSKLLERRMRSFRGATDYEIHKKVFIQLLRDVLDLGLYPQIPKPKISSDALNSYINNEQFWKETLDGRHREGMHVELRGFHVTEWLPTSPHHVLRSRAHGGVFPIHAGR